MPNWQMTIVNNSGMTISSGIDFEIPNGAVKNNVGPVSLTMPYDDGFVQIIEAIDNDYKNYVTTSRAIQIISGNYQRYWGYEPPLSGGAPLLLILTFNDDRTFSLSPDLSSNINFNSIPICGMPITQWAGIYQMSWRNYVVGTWGSSILIINDDGSVAITETDFTVTYNSKNSTFSVTAGSGIGTISGSLSVFNGNGASINLNGVLRGPPNNTQYVYQGTSLQLYPKPTISNLTLANGLFNDGDGFTLTTNNGLPLINGPNGILTAGQSGASPTSIRAVSFAQGSMDAGFMLSSVMQGFYLTADNSGNLCFTEGAGLQDGVILCLYLCFDGDIIIGTPNKQQFLNYNSTSGRIVLSSTTFLTLGFEFDIILDHTILPRNLNLSNVDGPIDCFLAEGQLAAQVLLGWLTAFGLGEFTFGGALWREVKALILEDSKATAAYNAMKVAMGIAGAGAVASAAAQFILAIDLNLYLKILKFAWNNFGVWALTKIAIKLVSFITPQSALTITTTLIELVSYVVKTTQAYQNYLQNCPSVNATLINEKSRTKDHNKKEINITSISNEMRTQQMQIILSSCDISKIAYINPILSELGKYFDLLDNLNTREKQDFQMTFQLGKIRFELMKINSLLNSKDVSSVYHNLLQLIFEFQTYLPNLTLMVYTFSPVFHNVLTKHCEELERRIKVILQELTREEKTPFSTNLAFFPCKGCTHSTKPVLSVQSDIGYNKAPAATSKDPIILQTNVVTGVASSSSSTGPIISM